MPHLQERHRAIHVPDSDQLPPRLHVTLHRNGAESGISHLHQRRRHGWWWFVIEELLAHAIRRYICFVPRNILKH